MIALPAPMEIVWHICSMVGSPKHCPSIAVTENVVSAMLPIKMFVPRFISIATPMVKRNRKGSIHELHMMIRIRVAGQRFYILPIRRVKINNGYITFCLQSDIPRIICAEGVTVDSKPVTGAPPLLFMDWLANDRFFQYHCGGIFITGELNDLHGKERKTAREIWFHSLYDDEHSFHESKQSGG